MPSYRWGEREAVAHADLCDRLLDYSRSCMQIIHGIAGRTYKVFFAIIFFFDIFLFFLWARCLWEWKRWYHKNICILSRKAPLRARICLNERNPHINVYNCKKQELLPVITTQLISWYSDSRWSSKRRMLMISSSKRRMLVIFSNLV